MRAYGSRRPTEEFHESGDWLSPSARRCIRFTHAEGRQSTTVHGRSGGRTCRSLPGTHGAVSLAKCAADGRNEKQCDWLLRFHFTNSEISQYLGTYIHKRRLQHVIGVQIPRSKVHL
jgi:hypothetical protein